MGVHHHAVDGEAKSALEESSGSPALHHSTKEDLEEIQNRDQGGVDDEVDGDGAASRVGIDEGTGDRVVDAVVDIEGARILIAHARAVDIGLVGKDDGRTRDVERHAIVLVVPDGDHHFGNLVEGEAKPPEQFEREEGTAVTVVAPIDEVADVVEIARDRGQLGKTRRVAQAKEKILRTGSHERSVTQTVFGVAESG
ncbi:MAG: hypothetical protein KatS3mg061_0039 [Dehalococcoidia bacterium]|nr:MAG: hypothetical protein KatS3mg061_0039 [Dehalococcoidia bacterium]